MIKRADLEKMDIGQILDTLDLSESFLDEFKGWAEDKHRVILLDEVCYAENPFIKMIPKEEKPKKRKKKMQRG